MNTDANVSSGRESHCKHCSSFGIPYIDYVANEKHSWCFVLPRREGRTPIRSLGAGVWWHFLDVLYS